MIALGVTGPMHPFRTFLSPDSPVGFGVADYVEIATAAIFVVGILLWAGSSKKPNLFGSHRVIWLITVAFLPVALRLALLPECPVPIASGADDFSYILLGDTLRHFRLANPPHALPQFFEQVFVLQEPTYSSMFPLGQGLFLTAGWWIFGHPWAGVLLSAAAFSGACYWMLRGWVSPAWSFIGGLLAVAEFGPLSYWMNSYWGGAVSATAGCLVYGALPRLRLYGRVRDACLLAIGMSLQLLTRPFEFVLLAVSVILFFLSELRTVFSWRDARKFAVPIVSIAMATVGLMALQNKRVTGHWTTLPYMLAQYQYGIPSTLTFQPNPVPHRTLNEEQQLAYRAQVIIHGESPETVRFYFDRLLFRVRFLRFFLLPPLYVALIAFFFAVRGYRWRWLLLTILCFALGSNFYPYFYPHYVAAVTSLFVLLSVAGIQKLNEIRLTRDRLRVPIGSVILLLCASHFVVWLLVHKLAGKETLSNFASLESWDYINYGDPQGRMAVEQQLIVKPGKKLVFVHYAPGHRFEEWVHNAADINASEVVWVHDLGPTENAKILRYYPQRSAWLLEPDYSPPKLTRYVIQSGGFQDVQ
ncbi:MAG: hypothetical protein JO217_07630 [Acidobacteriaceae bacterium]|nr:hypothetical protein [Acidobacteriaceae bacterium]